jgi:hypothetical protein
MSFEVGDKVRVKSLEEIEAMSRKEGDSWITKYKNSKGELDEGYFAEEMVYFCGNEYVICDVDEDGEPLYYFQGDSHQYYFLEDWLEPVTPQPVTPQYVVDFDGTVESSKKEELREVLKQLEDLTEKVRKLLGE